MPEQSSGKNGTGGEGLAALGIGALAIGCCAGLPLIVVVAGSVTAGTLLGVGAGLLGAIVLTGVIVLRVRARKRACEPSASRRVTAMPRRD